MLHHQLQRQGAHGEASSHSSHFWNQDDVFGTSPPSSRGLASRRGGGGRMPATRFIRRKHSIGYWQDAWSLLEGGSPQQMSYGVVESASRLRQLESIKFRRANLRRGWIWALLPHMDGCREIASYSWYCNTGGATFTRSHESNVRFHIMALFHVCGVIKNRI
jgi:hypothetical protein